MILFGVLEIKDAQALPFEFALRVAITDLHAVFEQVVFFTIGGEHAQGGAELGDLADGVFVGGLGQIEMLIEFDEGGSQVARQDYLLPVSSTQSSIFTEGFVVVGIDRVPAEFLLEVFSGGLLDEGIFGVVTHTGISPFIRRGRSRSRAC